MGKKDKELKTNAVRIVKARKYPYETHTYDADDGKIDGMSVAIKTNQEPGSAFKTLVLVGHSKEYYVCCVPVNTSLDLKKAAKYFKEKNIEMIHSKELLPLTGYIHGGCSPIGMKKQFKTVIDETALLYDNIFISGGRVGLQLEMSPEDIAELVNGGFADLSKE